MKLIKTFCLLNLALLLGVFVCAGSLMADPGVLLKAGRAQLEEWKITPGLLGLQGGFPNNYIAFQFFADSKNNTFNLNITADDILNPAVKLHVKKEFGLPIGQEEIEWSEKKWSANPLLEISDKTFLEWCPRTTCGKIFTLPEGGKQKAALQIEGGMLIPIVALNTGVIMNRDQFMESKVVEKYKKAAENQ